MTKKNPEVLVMGGGLAGCVCASELQNYGFDVLLVEKEIEIGGLLRGGNVSLNDIDLGPHFFFHDKADMAVREWVERHCQAVNLVPFAWTFPSGALSDPYPYPISRSAVESVTAAGSDRQLESDVRDTDFARSSFEDRMLAIAGRQLYDRFFKNFTKKFWGVDPRQLKPDIVSSKIRIAKGHEPFFGDKVCYRPGGGFREFLRSVTLGVPILHDRIKHIAVKNGLVSYALCAETGKIEARQYVSTLRPDLLIGENRLHLRGLVLVFAVLDMEVPFFENEKVFWGYFPNHHDFTRVTDMTLACCILNDVYRVLCFEFPTDHTDVRLNSVFIHEALEFLTSCGISKSCISEMNAVRIDEQAPVPSFRNKTMLRDFSKQFDGLANLHRIGRFGTFEFLWMRDVILQGIATADRIRLSLN